MSKDYTKETVIDFSNLPSDSSKIKFDIDFNTKDDTPIDEIDEDIDTSGDIGEFDIELDEIEIDNDDGDDVPVEKPKPKKPAPQKAETEVEAQEEEVVETVEQKAEVKRKNRSQERIRELAAERKKALEEKLALIEEKKALEQELINIRKQAAGSDYSSAEQMVKQAQYDYAKAHEEGDAVAIAEANTKLQRAAMQVEIAKLKKNQAETTSFKEDAYTQQVEQTRQQIQQENTSDYAEAPVLEEGAQRWLHKNKFIFSNPEMTQAAGILFDQLRDDGYDVTEFETYKELEERLISVFPNTEKLFKRRMKGEAEVEKETVEPIVKKVAKEAPPVGPSAVRKGSVGGQYSQGSTPGKVKYTPTREDVSMAKSMGVPLELFVKNKLRKEKATQNGNSYTEIFTS